MPFRGEYYALARPELVRGLVYPVPDPGVPLPRRPPSPGASTAPSTSGRTRSPPWPARDTPGPRSRPAELLSTLSWPGTWQIARRHWRYGAGEVHRSLSRSAFTRAVQRLLPAVTEDDLRPSPAGVRAQAVLRDGTLVDDFLIREAPHTVHVLNAPSPAATACLPIGREVARLALRRARGTGWKPPAVESGHCV
ncbi:FAD-dependent oxidoreductase [Streptomyces sp. SID4931]|nr:FAD-dependent oxidoreductase [Streptomyces sp. SID4931]